MEAYRFVNGVANQVLELPLPRPWSWNLPLRNLDSHIYPSYVMPGECAKPSEPGLCC